MEISINLPPDLEQDLMRQAKQANVSLQTLIFQALRHNIPTQQTVQWPEAILSYQGVPDFPALESYRDEFVL
ncbi:hypothetical protein [Spirulina sp. CS-785/01]|uniref:hypothetical protein n=1 Tax=Spirulina sp. CS-785/01 TaxID=3021716 RepID=UPI003FA76859